MSAQSSQQSSVRDRRAFLRYLIGAGGMLAFCRAQALTDPIAAATIFLTEGIAEATRRSRPYVLPPGVTTIYQLALPDGAHLLAARGGSTLRLGYAGPMISNALPCDRVTFEGVTFDGAGRPITGPYGLLTFTDVAHVEMDSCNLHDSAIALLNRRCGGRIRLSTFHDLTDTAVYDDNCAGMVIDANKIMRCGDNGVHHWSTKTRRHDGSRISNNVITDVSNRSRGDGLYGNGVRVAECGPVVVENNVIERCEYSAVRNTGGWDIVVANNRCKSFNERAMYAEFGFRNATFKNNVIEDCGAGIAATNYIGPGNGAGAEIIGNIVSKIRPSHPDNEFGPQMGWLSGIEGEGDVRIAGNIVTGSPGFGILAGFFHARQNVTVEGNRLIDNEYAIGVATQGDPGPCAIIANELRGSRKGNIVAMLQTEVVSGDLAVTGDAGHYKNLTLRDNRVS
jgi:uncharacterized secreted repeat protein (TIGR03808 family)